MKIILRGRQISTQHAYKRRGKRTFLTLEAENLKLDYSLQAREQFKGEPIKEKLGVRISLFFADKRKRDWDNWHKLSMDSLNKIIWNDDSQINYAEIIMEEPEKDDPRIEIEILEYLDLSL